MRLSRLALLLLVAALLFVLVFACGDDDDDDSEENPDSADDDTAEPGDDDTDAAGDDDAADDDDTDPGIPFPQIDWANLQNPILARDDRMLKDQSVVYHEGRFFIFSSTRFDDNDPDAAHKQKVYYSTTDFKTYETHYDENMGGPGSPDVIYADGQWHMVVQRNPRDDGSSFRRLYHSTSADLLSWEPFVEIAPEALPRIRSIDGALAWHNGRYYLAFKASQIMMVTRSMSDAIDGSWFSPRVARPGGLQPFNWAENYQFIRIDGKWRMIATGRDPDNDDDYGDYNGDHAPYIYTMAGEGSKLDDWVDWTNKRMLDVPREAWNNITIANCGFLCDWREHDGWFYLFYSGTDDYTSFQERGHGKIGVVRSKDLIYWKTPGDLSE